MNRASTTRVRRVALVARRGFTSRSRYNANCLRRKRFSAARRVWDRKASITKCRTLTTRSKAVWAITDGAMIARNRIARSPGSL
jgi:hypothetical protein